MEELQQLLAAMGCATAADALAQVARMNTQLAALSAATGRADAREAIQASAEAVGFARSVETELGVAGPAALAKIAGLKQAQARVAELEVSVAAQAKATADAGAATAIDAATADTRLTPADRPKAETIYAKYGLDGLKEYLDLLPKNAAGRPSAGPAPKQPKTPSEGGPSASSIKAELKAKGFSDAEIEAAEKLHTNIESGAAGDGDK